MTQTELLNKIKFPKDHIREQMCGIVDGLSGVQRLTIFKGWAKPGRIHWFTDEHMKQEDLQLFNETVERVSNHPMCKQIFVIFTRPKMAILMPGESEEQTLNELQKRALIL